MKYWAFTIGLRDDAPSADWLRQWPYHVHEIWFPRTKRPTAVSAGDRAVVYGSMGRGFIAAVEVLSQTPEANDVERFPWKLKHRLLVMKAADNNVASPEAAGINPNRVVRGPHTELSREEYQAAVRALLSAAEHGAL